MDALLKVDRINFIRPEDLNRAYMDNPLSIGYGQTISQPYTVVFMMELLQAENGNKVLDVGSGSGWTTALLAYIVQKEGSVLGMERVSDLVQFGSSNVEKYDFCYEKMKLNITHNTTIISINRKYNIYMIPNTSNSLRREN